MRALFCPDKSGDKSNRERSRKDRDGVEPDWTGRPITIEANPPRASGAGAGGPALRIESGPSGNSR